MFRLLLSLLITSTVTCGLEILDLDETLQNHQKCTGVWGTSTFSPQWTSSIIFNISKLDSSENGLVSVVMFELRDEHLGGITVQNEDGSIRKETLCSPENVAAGHCTSGELGEFLISDDAYRKARRPLITRAINLARPTTIFYPVRGPGYYCVATDSDGVPFHGTMTVFDGRGKLPSAQQPVLNLYNLLTSISVAFCLAWYMFKISRGPSEGFNPRESSLTILSSLAALAVAAKWLYYYCWDEDMEASLVYAILGTAEFLRALQLALLAYLLFMMVKTAGHHQTKEYRLRKIFWLANTVIMICLGMESIQSPYITSALGVIFSLGTFWAAWSLWSAVHEIEFEKRSRKSGNRGLLGGMLLGALASLGIVLVNVHALAFDHGTEQLFESRHWKTRWWWTEGVAFQMLSLIAVLWIGVCRRRLVCE